MNPGPLLLASMLGVFAGLFAGGRAPRVWLATMVMGSVSGLAAAVLVLSGGGYWESWSSFRIGGEAIHLRFDAISALFFALLSVIGGVGAVYASEYWSDVRHPRSAPSGRRWWSLLILSLQGVLLSANGLHFLIVWELFTVSAYFLITLDRQKSEVQAAGWLYLGASHVGMVCLFAFFGVLAARTGSWELGPGTREQVGAGWLWPEVRRISPACVVALGARECTQSCFGHLIGCHN